MSILQELNHREITQVILSAAERGLPLSLTVREGEHWTGFQSRLLGTKDQCLLLEAPLGEGGQTQAFPPARASG